MCLPARLIEYGEQYKSEDKHYQERHAVVRSKVNKYGYGQNEDDYPCENAKLVTSKNSCYKGWKASNT